MEVDLVVAEHTCLLEGIPLDDVHSAPALVGAITSLATRMSGRGAMAQVADGQALDATATVEVCQGG